MGGGIDPWPHLSAPRLLLRKHSGTGLKCHSHHWSDHRHTQTILHRLGAQYNHREEENKELNVDAETAMLITHYFTCWHGFLFALDTADSVKCNFLL